MFFIVKERVARLQTLVKQTTEDLTLEPLKASVVFSQVVRPAIQLFHTDISATESSELVLYEAQFDLLIDQLIAWSATQKFENLSTDLKITFLSTLHDLSELRLHLALASNRLSAPNAKQTQREMLQNLLSDIDDSSADNVILQYFLTCIIEMLQIQENASQDFLQIQACLQKTEVKQIMQVLEKTTSFYVTIYILKNLAREVASQADKWLALFKDLVSDPHFRRGDWCKKYHQTSWQLLYAIQILSAYLFIRVPGDLALLNDSKAAPGLLYLSGFKADEKGESYRPCKKLSTRVGAWVSLLVLVQQKEGQANQTIIRIVGKLRTSESQFSELLTRFAVIPYIPFLRPVIAQEKLQTHFTDPIQAQEKQYDEKAELKVVELSEAQQILLDGLADGFDPISRQLAIQVLGEMQFSRRDIDFLLTLLPRLNDLILSLENSLKTFGCFQVTGYKCIEELNALLNNLIEKLPGCTDASPRLLEILQSIDKQHARKRSVKTAIEQCYRALEYDVDCIPVLLKMITTAFSNKPPRNARRSYNNPARSSDVSTLQNVALEKLQVINPKAFSGQAVLKLLQAADLAARYQQTKIHDGILRLLESIVSIHPSTMLEEVVTSPLLTFLSSSTSVPLRTFCLRVFKVASTKSSDALLKFVTLLIDLVKGSQDNLRGLALGELDTLLTGHPEILQQQAIVRAIIELMCVRTVTVQNFATRTLRRQNITAPLIISFISAAQEVGADGIQIIVAELKQMFRSDGCLNIITQSPQIITQLLELLNNPFRELNQYAQSTLSILLANGPDLHQKEKILDTLLDVIQFSDEEVVVFAMQTLGMWGSGKEDRFIESLLTVAMQTSSTLVRNMALQELCRAITVKPFYERNPANIHRLLVQAALTTEENALYRFAVREMSHKQLQNSITAILLDNILRYQPYNQRYDNRISASRIVETVNSLPYTEAITQALLEQLEVFEPNTTDTIKVRTKVENIVRQLDVSISPGILRSLNNLLLDDDSLKHLVALNLIRAFKCEALVMPALLENLSRDEREGDCIRTIGIIKSVERITPEVKQALEKAASYQEILTVDDASFQAPPRTDFYYRVKGDAQFENGKWQIDVGMSIRQSAEDALRNTTLITVYDRPLLSMQTVLYSGKGPTLFQNQITQQDEARVSSTQVVYEVSL